MIPQYVNDSVTQHAVAYQTRTHFDTLMILVHLNTNDELQCGAIRLREATLRNLLPK